MSKKNNTIAKVLFLTLPIILTHSTMLITSPAINPFDNSSISYSYSNIGTIPYGKTLTFDLVDSTGLDLCKSH
jgi:Cft2 family RNA processing exonuclease